MKVTFQIASQYPESGWNKRGFFGTLNDPEEMPLDLEDAVLTVDPVEDIEPVPGWYQSDPVEEFIEPNRALRGQRLLPLLPLIPLKLGALIPAGIAAAGAILPAAATAAATILPAAATAATTMLPAAGSLLGDIGTAVGDIFDDLFSTET